MEKIAKMVIDINKKYEYLIQEGASVKDLIKLLDSSIAELWHAVAKINYEQKNMFYSNVMDDENRLLYLDYLTDNKRVSANDTELLLDHIVYLTRQRICLYDGVCVRNGAFLDTRRKCRIASGFTKRMTDAEENIDNSIILLSTAFGLKYYDHAFNYVKLDDKYYVIDCTYSQFLPLFFSSLDTILVTEICNACPGYFMTTSKKKYALLEQLLNRGWFEATDENLKIYLDSFVLAQRNGKFYLNNNISMTNTEFSGNDYKKMLHSYLSRLENSTGYTDVTLFDYDEFPKYGESDELGIVGFENFDNNKFMKLSKKVKKEKKKIRF